MHEIKETDLTESEMNFVENLLDTVERELSFDGTKNIVESHKYFPNALEPLIEAEQVVREADSGVEVTGKEGELIDVDLKLTAARIDYKNDVIQLKRNLGIANELKNILDIVDRLISGKKGEYSQKVSGLREQIDETITGLSDDIVHGQKIVDEINKSPNPLDRSISTKNEK